ncbi:four-carbon acid sugar kinase family protein [Orbaceae bacterium ac157xtp]
MSNCFTKLLIIADDFTGANDSGVQMTKKGAQVNVYFEWESPLLASESNVIVINTDSRAIPTLEAKERIKTVIKNNKDEHLIYKKIDSTLRGNLGSEIEAILNHSNYEAAIIVPAFPDMKRTVKNGILFVNSKPLKETEFATDPKTPIYSSNIKQILAQQTPLKSYELSLDIIKNGQLAPTINEQLAKGIKLFIIDTETNQDLQSIVEQIKTIKNKLLLVGSAGLIQFLPTDFNKKELSHSQNKKSPLLVIAGSMSETTQAQIEYALKHGENWHIIDLDINNCIPHFSNEDIDRYATQINGALLKNQHVILRTCKNSDVRFQIEDLCKQHHISRQQLGEHIASCLGKISQRISIKNLFLTGGDIAIAVAKALGANGFYIEGEVTAGVPFGKLIKGTQKQDYRIFTKAGGFGEPDILIKSLDYIGDKWCQK